VASELLALLVRPGSAPATLDAAAAVAACYPRAALTVLHVRHDPRSLILATEEVLTERRRALEAAEEARAEQLRRVFERWSMTAGAAAAGASRVDEVGEVGHSLARYGARAALVILGHEPRALHEDDRAAVKAALLELRRPVLLVPGGWQGGLGRRVAIAWKPSEQAARALAAAAPILARAERVVALAVQRPGKDTEPELRRALGSHGLGAALERIEPDGEPAGALLLRRAQEGGADLLVAGAYSHSRAYELVLGGVTRHLLHHAGLPVLMAH
jgi:nucleotide-binding universal stress UspA family protein